MPIYLSISNRYYQDFFNQIKDEIPFEQYFLYEINDFGPTILARKTIMDPQKKNFHSREIGYF